MDPTKSAAACMAFSSNIEKQAVSTWVRVVYDQIAISWDYKIEQD